MSIKEFYDHHKNFSARNRSEYDLSPGIRCKFDLLIKRIGNSRTFKNAIDLGCSGNSLLYILENVQNKSYCDISAIPLKQYSKQNPLCGDIVKLPYKNNTFDLVLALDVLEHVKCDDLAISEIKRILTQGGFAVITVPHRMKYYSKQDKIIGHYRRYEIEQVLGLFQRYNFKYLKHFGVYGILMKMSLLQSINPKNTEKNLIKLRNKYRSNLIFRKIWNLFVKLSSSLMKIDAKYYSPKRMMNMAFIFLKL